MKSYWSNRIDRLTREIESAGWRVVHKKMRGTLVGSCDYDRKTITLHRDFARDAFMTLCHEDGHRKAFKLHGSRNERAFRRQCRLRQFRELQACVLGWHTLCRFTNRVSLREWMETNQVSIIEGIRHEGRT